MKYPILPNNCFKTNLIWYHDSLIFLNFLDACSYALDIIIFLMISFQMVHYLIIKT